VPSFPDMDDTWYDGGSTKFEKNQKPTYVPSFTKKYPLGIVL
jgi:hypothetical protein